MARDCKSSPKGGKAGGKGTRFMGAYSGKGGSPSGPVCPECGKPGHSRDKCWKLHPELIPAKFRKKVQGVEGEEDQLGVIEICSVEPLDPLSCRGNTNFEKQFPILSREIKIQNKYTLLEDDNDEWDPSGNKSVVGSVFVTTPMNKLQKISSRRIKSGEWSKIKLTPLPIPASKKPPVAKRAPVPPAISSVGVSGGHDLGKIQESTTSSKGPVIGVEPALCELEHQKKPLQKKQPQETQKRTSLIVCVHVDDDENDEDEKGPADADEDEEGDKRRPEGKSEEPEGKEEADSVRPGELLEGRAPAALLGNDGYLTNPDAVMPGKSFSSSLVCSPAQEVARGLDRTSLPVPYRQNVLEKLLPREVLPREIPPLKPLDTVPAGVRKYEEAKQVPRMGKSLDVHSATEATEAAAISPYDPLSEGQDACQNFGNAERQDAAQNSDAKNLENGKRWKRETDQGEDLDHDKGQDHAENSDYTERQDAAQILTTKVSGNQERWKIETEGEKE